VAASRRFSRYRTKYGLTLHTLAALTGSSPSTLWRVEAGKIDPAPTLKEILGAIHRLYKAKPAAARRVHVMLLSSGRLAALSFVLRTSLQTSQLKR
jgi:transcriptional regulator with XRE-family HTH domain